MGDFSYLWDVNLNNLLTKRSLHIHFGKYQQDIPVGSCTWTPNLEEISTQHGTFGTSKDSDVFLTEYTWPSEHLIFFGIQTALRVQVRYFFLDVTCFASYRHPKSFRYLMKRIGVSFAEMFGDAVLLAILGMFSQMIPY